MIDMIFVDKKFRLPRIWSNSELKKFAHLFYGDIVNVSGWQDKDKEGGDYRDYFSNKKTYSITNFIAEARGFQGMEDEIFLDLEKGLPIELENKYDVVFNHTVLEHIFNIDKAFTNLCQMSRDIVIIVVPFLQQMHADYGDYWRMTPLAVIKMFEKNGLKVLYLSFNDHPGASVYLFAIASKNPNKWKDVIKNDIKMHSNILSVDGFENFAGSNSLSNKMFAFKKKILKIFKS